MSRWYNYKHDRCVERNYHTIKILRLDKARAVSDIIREIDYITRVQKQKSITIDFGAVTKKFPNALVPCAGIIKHYESNGIEFKFTNCSQSIEHSQLLEPVAFDGDSRHVMSKVWKFSTSEEVCKIEDAYIVELQKSAKFYRGVLNSIEWSLNEVMDNVIQHSKIGYGYVMGQLHSSTKNIAFAVFDCGQGIYNSLKDSIHNPQHAVDSENWLANYEALKAHVLETGHFPNKHDKRLNWAKFQMKKIKAGTLEPERQRLFEELMAMRSGEHTGGRKKTLPAPPL